jgi:hypothetical protein
LGHRIGIKKSRKRENSGCIQLKYGCVDITNFARKHFHNYIVVNAKIKFAKQSEHIFRLHIFLKLKIGLSKKSTKNIDKNSKTPLIWLYKACHY